MSVNQLSAWLVEIRTLWFGMNTDGRTTCKLRECLMRRPMVESTGLSGEGFLYGMVGVR